MVKKWAQKVDLDEGSLTALGWPSASKIASSISSGKVTYREAIQKLVFIANVSGRKNPELAKRAKAIIATLRKKFGKED